MPRRILVRSRIALVSRACFGSPSSLHADTQFTWLISTLTQFEKNCTQTTILLDPEFQRNGLDAGEVVEGNQGIANGGRDKG